MAWEHVKTGDPFEVEAFEWNAMQDAAKAFQQAGRQVIRPGSEIIRPQLVNVKNVVGEAVERYSAWVIKKGDWSGELTEDMLLEEAYFLIDDTEFDAAVHTLAVVQTGLAENAIGKAVIFGNTFVRHTANSLGPDAVFGNVVDGDLEPTEDAGEAGVRFAYAPPNSDGLALATVGLSSGGSALYVYTLTGATATIYKLVAGSIGPSVKTGVTVHDPLGMFADQTIGDSGYCIKRGGYYYRIQAPCTT